MKTFCDVMFVTGIGAGAGGLIGALESREWMVLGAVLWGLGGMYIAVQHWEL